ncbi:efflux RND transporter periplasmic adaptor subunit [Hydrogenophaga sp.]|uniref:efflux RND transporter periplasmic adaptor subunit n=1 Tax=Hydrogenophaga sp. TaxID=1904254 RepID=UPI0025BC1668|nr:efflux RND transporter periplasmic adaptor subunit [Hydrogenophaga sp.]
MNAPTRRTAWIKWLLLVLLVLGIALGVARALQKRAAQAAAANAAAQALHTAPVFQLLPQDVITVQSLALDQTVAFSGSLRAVQTAMIKARVAGELQGLNKREGDTVRAGEVVARIDSTEAQARVRQAEQQAAAAQAQVAIAQRGFDNNQALVKQGFISATALDTASGNLAAAQANHQAALAALDIARKSLGDTVLKSPLAGEVAARMVQNGERVGVDARVLEVVDLSVFEIEAALAPADAARVQTGQAARLLVEGLSTPVEATVARINPSVQTGSRSVLIYLRVRAAAGMRQGLFVQGAIVTGSLNAPAVPLSSVRNDKPQPYIQVLRDGAIAHVPVPLTRQAQHDGEPMVVIDGVSAAPVGAIVLRVQAGLIREGTAVTLLDASAAAVKPAN